MAQPSTPATYGSTTFTYVNFDEVRGQFDELPTRANKYVTFQTQEKEDQHAFFEANVGNIPLVDISCTNSDKYFPALAFRLVITYNPDHEPGLPDKIDPSFQSWALRVKSIYVKLFRDTCERIDRSDLDLIKKDEQKLLARLRLDAMISKFREMRYGNEEDLDGNMQEEQEDNVDFDVIDQSDSEGDAAAPADGAAKIDAKIAKAAENLSREVQRIMAEFNISPEKYAEFIQKVSGVAKNLNPTFASGNLHMYLKQLRF